MTTATKTLTLRDELDKANPNTLADALRRVGLGKMLSVIKAVFVGLATGASYDITTAASKAAATITGITLGIGENLPAIGRVLSLRVTAATTATVVGSYAITDKDGTVLTPATSSVVGLAKISDDGKSLTFASADVTAFVLEYIPRAENEPTEAFSTSI